MKKRMMGKRKEYELLSNPSRILGKNVTNDFYTTGTYCSVEYNSEDANRIVIAFFQMFPRT